MKVERFKIKKDKRVEQAPFVRASLKGEGCGAGNCPCSPPCFLTISDGKTGFMVKLTKAEAKAILSGWASLTEN